MDTAKQLAAALINTGSSGQGLAPFGARHAGDSAKGRGFFGILPSTGQGGEYSTELAFTFGEPGKEFDAPLMVPTLTQAELNHLLSGGQPTDVMFDKAYQHAIERKQRGLSPFMGYGEMKSTPGTLE